MPFFCALIFLDVYVVVTSEQELGVFCSAPEELETGVGYLIV